MSKAEKIRKLLDELGCQACGRMLEIQTKGICAPSCGSEYRLNDEIELELSEIEAKADKRDDPQTQADLELAAAVKLAFKKDLQIGEMQREELDNWAPYFERTIWSEEELIDWYREQKRGCTMRDKERICFVVEYYSNSCYCETFEQAKDTLKQGIVDTEYGIETYQKAMSLTEIQLPCKIGDFELRAIQVNEEEWKEISSQEFDGF